MPDITMCEGTGCPQANQCYRHRAIPNEFRQSFFTVPPMKPDGCEYFSKIMEGDRLRPESRPNEDHRT